MGITSVISYEWTCDNCGKTATSKAGDGIEGEDAEAPAWLQFSIGQSRLLACTNECAVELVKAQAEPPEETAAEEAPPA